MMLSRIIELKYYSTIRHNYTCDICNYVIHAFNAMLLLQANIEAALNKLCDHLPGNLIETCVDFVKGYSKELVELMIADLTPQEICVFLKLCDPNEDSGPKQGYISEKNGEIRELFLRSLYRLK